MLRVRRLRQQTKFPSFDTVNIPMVLVLGNHSSGKSTFINYMLGQEVQKTGNIAIHDQLTAHEPLAYMHAHVTLAIAIALHRSRTDGLHVHGARGRQS